MLATFNYNSLTGLLAVETDQNSETLSIISTSNSGNYTITTTGAWTGVSTTDVGSSGTNLIVNSTANITRIQITNNVANSGSAFYFGVSTGNFVDNLSVNFTNSTSGPITVANAASFINSSNLNLISTGNQITVSSPVSANGSGGISLTSRNVSVTGNITATAGDITLRGNTGSYQAGAFDGVRISGSTVNVNTTSGNITIDGRASGSSNYTGVNLTSSKVQAGGAGCVTVTGVSGNGSTGYAYGFFANGATVTTTNGTLTANGTSWGTGIRSYAVYLATSANLSAVGTGSVAINGNAACGTTWAIGVYASASNITVTTGSISLYGTTYGTEGAVVRGLLLDSGTNVKATGAGNITAMASAKGDVGFSTYGTNITSNGGSITINGTNACLTRSGIFGIYMGTTRISTIGAGNVSITGNMACASDNSFGFYADNNVCVTTSNGMITVIGTVNGTAQINMGVKLKGSNFTATGAGNISVIGTAIGGTHNQDGVVVEGTVIRTNTGTLTVNGTAGGPQSWYVRGVSFSGSNTYVESTGSGNVSVTGLASGTDMCWAVRYSSASTRVNTGTLTVNGTSYGTGPNEDIGIKLDGSGSYIGATGSGNVNIIGGTTGKSIASWGIQYWDSTNHRIYANGGQITISANSILLNAALNAISGGNVVIQTLGAGVNLGGADSPANLGLTATELGWITANQLTIGSSRTGPIVNTAAISRTNATIGTNLSVVSGNSITQTGAGCLSISGRANFVSSGTGSAGNVTLSNATNSFLGLVTTTGSAVQIANASGSTLNGTSPASVSVSANQTANFSITASGNGTPAVQWQKQAPGSSWANITGANATTYTTPVNVASDDGTKYRAVVTNSLGSFTTNSANLAVLSVVMTLDVGGLQFQTDTGFQPSGSTYSVTGPVYVGYVPANGGSFYRLLELNGNVSVDTSALSFSASGALKASVLNPSITLVSGGITSGSISDLINGKIAGLAGSVVTVAGVNFTLDRLGFSSTGDNGNPLVQLQGSVALPGGLNLAVNGTNTVNVTTSGFFLTGATASLSNNFTLGATTFSAANLTGSYISSTNTFTVTGQSSATVTGLGNVVVTLGNTAVGSAGLVVTNGTLQRFDAGITGNLSVAGASFSTNNLILTANTATNIFTISGGSNFTANGIGSVSVYFGGANSTGLVLTNGSLTSVNATLNSNLTVAGTTFTTTGLNILGNTAANTFKLSGNSSLTLPNMGNVNLILGGAGSTGVVIANGSLSSLYATATTNLSLAGGNFSSTGLTVNYVSAGSNLSIYGSANFTYGGNNLSLVLGNSASPGMVIANNALSSLNATANTAFSLAGGNFTANSLTVNYVSAGSNLSISGNASFRFGSNNLSLVLGNSASPGMVIANGSLTSLNASATTNMTLSGGNFTANSLTMVYTASPEKFSIYGNANFRYGSNNLSLVLGNSANPGMVIANGSLSSLNASATTNMTLSGGNFTANSLTMIYAASPEKFSIYGNANFRYGSNNLSLVLGNSASPGMVIANGSLTSLNASATTNMTLSGGNFTANSLTMIYAASPEKFSIYGNANFRYGSNNLSLVLGNSASPGMVIANGTLANLNASATTNMTVAGANLTANSLTMIYTSSPERFNVYGNASFRFGSNNLSIVLGDSASPGMVIANGVLSSFNSTFSGNLSILNTNFSANSLNLTANSASNTFTIKGNASLTVPNMGNLSVILGGSNSTGLIATNGSVTSVNMTVNSNLRVAGSTFNTTGLRITANTSTNAFTMTGNSSLTVPSVGNISVIFGGANSTGLVVTNSTLTSMNVTVSGNVSILGTNITANSLNLTANAAANTFTMTGNATMSVPSMGNLSVIFGGANSTGMVLTNGSLTSVNMTVNSNLTVAGSTFNTTGLRITANTSTNAFTMTGNSSLTVPSVGNISVIFGGANSTGLVVTNSTLTSMNVTVSGNVSILGTNITANRLNLTANASANTFTMTGNATMSVPSMGNLSVIFGGANSTGMVLTNGSLTSVNMTVNSNLTVAGSTFQTVGLNITANTSTKKFTMKGNASLNMPSIGAVSVGFGCGSTTGLEVTNGVLTTLNATVTGNLSIGSVSFATNNLTFAVNTVNDTFSLTGGSSFSATGLGNVNVYFGGTGSIGLVIANGAMTSLNMTVSSNLAFAGVTFNTTNMIITADTANSIYTLTGNTSAGVTGIGNIAVQFGKKDSNNNNISRGLVITSGSLSLLDMTVNSNITVAGQTFSTTNLRLLYAAANTTTNVPAQFSMTGLTSATITSLGTISVGFGCSTSAGNATKGLVISGGSLTSLDMTVNTNITAGGLTFRASNLTFAYFSASNFFAMKGASSVSVPSVGNLSVTFGNTTNNGLVVTNGSLTSLDMTVNSNLNVGSLAITTRNLNFNYVSASSNFTMKGTAAVNMPSVGNLDVTFGNSTRDGLVITNGNFSSLDMTVNSNFSAGGMSFTTRNLNIYYVNANSLFALTGTAAATMPSIGNVEVTFGKTAANGTIINRGLVITNGGFTSLDLTVNSNFSSGNMQFYTKDLNIQYYNSNSTFMMKGTAGADLPSIGNVNVTFGNSTRNGLVFVNGAFQSFDFTLNSNIRVGSVTITTQDLNFAYTESNKTFSMRGTAGAAMPSIGNVNVTLGNSTKNGLVITNGSLVSLDMTINSNFRAGSIQFTTRNLNFTYVTSTAEFTMSGTAAVAMPSLGSLEVTLGKVDSDGTVRSRGLVVQNGNFVSLDMTVNADIRVGAVLLYTRNLNFTYVEDTKIFTMSGTAGALMPIGIVEVTLGKVDADGTVRSRGLVVKDGNFVSLDMTINSTLIVGVCVIYTKDLNFTYVMSTDTFTMSGRAGAIMPGMGYVDITMGQYAADGTKLSSGLIVVGGNFVSMDMTLNSSFSVNSVTFTTKNLNFTYVESTKVFTLTGSATVSIPILATVEVIFGGGDT